MYVYLQSMMNGDKYGTINRSLDYRAPFAQGNTFSEFPHLFRQVQPGEYLLDLEGADGNFYAPRFNSNWEEKILGKQALSMEHHLENHGGIGTTRITL